MGRKITITAFVALAVALVALRLCVVRLNAEHAETERLRANQTALTDSVSAYRTAFGLKATEVRQLTLTKAELKEVNSRLARQIGDMRIRLRDVQSAQTVAAGVEVFFVPDTVVIHDGNGETAVSVQYHDPWMDFRMDTAGVSVSTRDTVVVVSHARTRRFLWWTWKRYSGRTTVVSRSPHARTTIVESVAVDNK